VAVTCAPKATGTLIYADVTVPTTADVGP